MNEQPPRNRKPDPLLITEAAWSRPAQHAARKKRYAITMGIRTICLILAVVVYHTVWLMLIFAILGTILPWIAVVMANDGPPRSQLARQHVTPRPDRQLEDPARSGRVIDG